MRFLVRWLINALALLAAAFVVPGIRLTASGNQGLNEWMALAVVALIFGVINAASTVGTPAANFFSNSRSALQMSSLPAAAAVPTPSC